MEQLKSDTISRMYQDYVSKGLPVIKRGKIRFIPCMRDGAKKYFVMALPNQQFKADPISIKIGWGEFGKYVFTYAVKTLKEETLLNFSTLAFYNTETGEQLESTDAAYGKVSLGKVIILNGQILAVCGEKNEPPRFYAIIGKKLKEVPATVAESALRFSHLSDQHKQVLMEYYSREGWEQHNGIIINPETNSVPNEMLFQFWKRGRRYKAELLKLDMEFLAKLLTRTDNEKPVIKYIKL